MDTATCYLCKGNMGSECHECWVLEPHTVFNAMHPSLWFALLANFTLTNFMFAWMIFTWPNRFGRLDGRDPE